MKLTKTPKPASPQFFDKPIGEIQDHLAATFTWLDHAFGKCQRLVKERDKRSYHYPAAHISKGKYESLLPGQHLGNFSFVELHDPQEIGEYQRSNNRATAKVSIIFWLNVGKIAASDDRTTEVIKAQILKALTRDLFLKSGSLSISSVSERAENVYKGYDMKEVENQFIMQPFAGFRFEGTLSLIEPC